MKVLQLVLLAALCACAVHAQSLVQKRVIDAFTPDSPTIIIVLATNLSLPHSTSNSAAGDPNTQIIGGERDMQLTAQTGPIDRIVTSGVTNGQWQVSTPNGASSTALMQYDGVDGTIQLQANGLGGTDLTTNSGSSFQIDIQSDLPCSYTFTIFTGSASSVFTQSIPGDSQTHTYTIPFTSFSGSASFTSIGAIEVDIDALQNVDTFAEDFFVVGPASEPPPPGVSPTPSPAPDGETFTWYTFDDEDDGRSPCGDEPPRRSYFLSDNHIFYYYVFPQNGYPNIGATQSTGAALSASASVFAFITVLLVALLF